MCLSEKHADSASCIDIFLKYTQRRPMRRTKYYRYIIKRRVNHLLIFGSLLLTGCQSMMTSSQSCIHDQGNFHANGCDEFGKLAGNSRLNLMGHSADAIPAPPGTYVNGWNDAMICSARNQEYVVSRHEWFSGGEQLGPDGRKHVQRLAQSLATHDGYVFIEEEPVDIQSRETYDEALIRTQTLNEHRGQVVASELQELGIADAHQRVIIGPLDRVGIRGVESPRVYNQILFGGGRGGGLMGGAGMGMGGMGMGGMGGGGMGGGFGGGGFF